MYFKNINFKSKIFIFKIHKVTVLNHKQNTAHILTACIKNLNNFLLIKLFETLKLNVVYIFLKLNSNVCHFIFLSKI
jgi:hypothetical protein